MKIRPPYVLLILCLFFFSLMTTGSILSPDNEIVFRVAESLQSRYEFPLDHELESWHGFGTARGIDGKLYSVFGPLESLVLTPFVAAASAVNSTEWYRSLPALVPMSYHIDDGLQRRYTHQPPQQPEEHALRFLASFANVIISTLGVYVFWLIVMKLVQEQMTALFLSLVYAFGTMAWNYSGTLFSEPLATLFVLLSLKELLPREPPDHSNDLPPKNLFFGGLYLGLAVAAHLSAILFAPFFVVYGAWASPGRANRLKNSMKPFLFWSIGCGIILLFVGYYNYARFGSFLETGRGVDPTAVQRFGYGTFVAPWEGLWALLVSPSKGLLMYSPAILIGLLTWRKFHKAFPKLSWMLLTVLIVRWIFISSRSDWHGGFCLGPRYMLMVVPLCLLPTSVWLREQLARLSLRKLSMMIVGLFVLICEQVYFCIGEVFSCYYLLTFYANAQKVNPFKDDQIYLSADYAPIFKLFVGWRGPVFLSVIPVSNVMLCWMGFGVVFLMLFVWLLRLKTCLQFNPPSSRLADSGGREGRV